MSHLSGSSSILPLLCFLMFGEIFLHTLCQQVSHFSIVIHVVSLEGFQRILSKLCSESINVLVLA